MASCRQHRPGRAAPGPGPRPPRRAPYLISPVRQLSSEPSPRNHKRHGCRACVERSAEARRAGRAAESTPSNPPNTIRRADRRHGAANGPARKPLGPRRRTSHRIRHRSDTRKPSRCRRVPASTLNTMSSRAGRSNPLGYFAVNPLTMGDIGETAMWGVLSLYNS